MPDDISLVMIERLTRVEEKLDNAIDYMTADRTRLDSQEGRIRSLETQGARLLGMGTVIAAIAGLFSSKAVEMIASVGGHG